MNLDLRVNIIYMVSSGIYCWCKYFNSQYIVYRVHIFDWESNGYRFVSYIGFFNYHINLPLYFRWIWWFSFMLCQLFVSTLSMCSPKRNQLLVTSS